MTLTWLQIVRLGLVQLCLGAVVVLTTSEAEKDVVKAAAAAAIPYTIPALLNLAMRNLPLIAALAAALFLLSRPNDGAADGRYAAPAE